MGADASSEDAAPASPRGLFGQIGALRDAIRRLVMAHVELARAEAGEILDEIKRVAALATLAILALLIAILIVAIGTALFLGEVLFGSIGWGLIHAPLFYAAVAIALILYAVGVGVRTILIDLAAASLIGLIVALGLVGDLGTAIWGAVAEQAVPGLDPVLGRVLMAAAVIGILGGLVAAIAGGIRGGARAALNGFVAGLLIGAVIGLMMAIGLEARVAAAIGVAVALAAWSALMGYRVQRGGIDMDAFTARFIPQKTMDTTRETMEWVRSRTPLGRE